MNLENPVLAAATTMLLGPSTAYDTLPKGRAMSAFQGFYVIEHRA